MCFIGKTLVLVGVLGSVLLFSATLDGALSPVGALCLLPAVVWATGKLAFAVLQPAPARRPAAAARRRATSAGPSAPAGGGLSPRRSPVPLRAVPGGRQTPRGPHDPRAA